MQQNLIVEKEVQEIHELSTTQPAQASPNLRLCFIDATPW